MIDKENLPGGWSERGGKGERSLAVGREKEREM